MVDVSWMWAQVITAMEVLEGPRFVYGAVRPASCTLAWCWLSQLHGRGSVTVLRSVRTLEPACHLLCPPVWAQVFPAGKGTVVVQTTEGCHRSN